MKIISLAFLFSIGALAQTVDLDQIEEPKPTPKQRLMAEITSLEKAQSEDFGKAIERVSLQIEEYADLRKKECTGEYSSLEINEDGETKTYKNKLSKEEKKLCLLELIKLRKDLANSLFKARKKHLLLQHGKQLENLDLMRQETIKELEVMAGKLK